MFVIPVTARCMAYGCSCLIARIAGSKSPTEGMDVGLLCLLCVVQVASSETR